MTRTRGDTLLNSLALTVGASFVLNLSDIPRFSLQSNFSDVTPALKTFAPGDVNVPTDNINIVAHGFTTGLKVQASSTGTLPSGLVVLTDYFVIVIDADNVKLASSLANAQSGTPLLINSQGTGTHTLTPSPLKSGTVQLQSSNDNENFVNIDDMRLEISAGGSTLFNFTKPAYRFLKYNFTPFSGSLNLGVILNGYDGSEEVGR